MKKLVILHSNDIHADFLSTEENDEMVGGIAMLSGYLKKVRAEEEDVMYLIAGDLFNGSVIDSEFCGLTTLLMINHLAPDAVCVGNHEVDYGIAHTLFIQRCANFPILNANIYIKYLDKRLYQPYVMLQMAGANIIVVGVTTDKIAGSLKKDPAVGPYIDVRDPVEEVTNIIKDYDGKRADLAILLTHIGYEEDIELAKTIGSDPENGVDLIIGGHSHTLIEEPAIAGGVCIVQAGTGTRQIGRFDIYYDEKEMKVNHYDWSIIPIDASHCPYDQEIVDYLNEIKGITDQKYKRVLCTIPRKLTYENRNRYTDLCAFVVDILKKRSGVDVYLLMPITLRSPEMGPEITVEDMTNGYPYPSEVYCVKATVGQFRQMMEYMLNKIDDNDRTSALIHPSANVAIVFDRSKGKITSMTIDGVDNSSDQVITIGMNNFMYNAMERYYGISAEELEQNGKMRKIAPDDRQLIMEALEEGDFDVQSLTDRFQIIDVGLS